VISHIYNRSQGGVALTKRKSMSGAAPHNGAGSLPAKPNSATVPPLPLSRFVMPAKNDRKRITLIVSATLDYNIELFSFATGRMKTEIVVAALSEFLQRNNIDPTQDRRGAVRDLLHAPTLPS
jgi:hypothetical protein